MPFVKIYELIYQNIPLNIGIEIYKQIVFRTPSLTIAYQKRFKEVVENKYKGWKHINTDESTNKFGVGAAANTGKRRESASLTKFSSISTAVKKCSTPSSENNLCNKKKELHYIHRLENLPISISTAKSA